MMADFVKVVDTHKRVQIINIRQIVRVFRNPPNWDVILKIGDPLALDDLETEKLLNVCRALKRKSQTSFSSPLCFRTKDIIPIAKMKPKAPMFAFLGGE